jgi:hypothetical protein
MTIFVKNKRMETLEMYKNKKKTFALSKPQRVPDADLARAITKDELLTGIKSDIQAMYTKYAKAQ